jgi:putative membrane protein
MTVKRICNRVLVNHAIVVLAMAAVFVQSGSAQSTAAPQGGYSAPSLPGVGVAGPVTTVPHNFGDEAFVRSVLERDAGDLQLGQLAQQKSQSDDVKELGQKIVASRNSLDDQFMIIARTFEVTKPKGPTKKDKQLIARLQGLSGPQFDEEFIQTMAKIHRQDIKDFGTEAQTAQDARVVAAAQQDGAGLSNQLQAIQQVAKAHNVAIEDKK